MFISKHVLHKLKKNVLSSEDFFPRCDGVKKDGCGGSRDPSTAMQA